MSIINNASPGSAIHLIFLIDRVLTKRKNPIQKKGLLELCRPDNLPDTVGAEKRFESNLNFWIKEGLWLEDENGVRSSKDSTTEDNLPDRLLRTIIQNALAKDNQNICEGNGIEPFLTSITCLLAQNNYTFLGGEKLISGSTGNTPQVVNRFLPDKLKINLSNDAPTLLEFGFLLGFLEPLDEKSFIVDPTRAIQSVLEDIFAQTKEMNIREFIKQISIFLPMLDTGIFRQQIEPLMVEKGWAGQDSHVISFSLSHALIRLLNGFSIALDSEASDAMGSMRMQIKGTTRLVSKVRYIGGAL